MQAIYQAKTLCPEANTSRVYEDLFRLPSIQKTRRLPRVVLFNLGMRVRLTMAIQQLVVVHNVEGLVIGFDPDPRDSGTLTRLLTQTCAHEGDFAGPYMPNAMYVRLDDCELLLLTPAQCPDHSTHSSACSRCIRAAQPGVMAILPVDRTIRYFHSTEDPTPYVSISRKQIPLMPAPAAPLY